MTTSRIQTLEPERLDPEAPPFHSQNGRLAGFGQNPPWGRLVPAGPAPEPSPADTAALLAETLSRRRFDLANPPPPAVPLFTIGGAKIATAGNLLGIQGQAKAGKTALVSAMHAATMEPDGDCLGLCAENAQGQAVVHFDTEQSPADHHAVALTALRRAGKEEPPAFYRNYRVADVPWTTRRSLIAFEMERAAAECGGIHSVFLDGLADFMMDPNDSKEAFAFIDELHQLAIRHATVIVCVLHENPGTETGKTRGHLGSQLERKAETNLRLSKAADEVVTVYSERARHAHIAKDRGPRFQWSHEEGMHVTVATGAETKATAKQQDAEHLADEVYQSVPAGMGLRYTEMLQAIGQVLDIKKEGARRHFNALRAAQLIYKNRRDQWVRK